jgi:hypothetical protein
VGKKNGKRKISVEASRKALLNDLRTKCKGKPITKKISFTNDDVPKYLKWLKERQETSRNIRIVVT